MRSVGGETKSFPMASTKRKRESDSDNETNDDYFPRFLVLQDTKDSSGLLNLSPFAIAKGLQGLAGEPKSVKKTTIGIVVEVVKKSHADNLLKSTSIANIPIQVSEHRTLNTCKGVIRCRDLAGLSDEDIANELSDQKVTLVKRILIERGTKPTNTFIVTFKGSDVPSSLKIGYMNIRVDAYIPNPLRCFKCQEYGHGSAKCKGKERCSRCGQGHPVTECNEKPFCVHCSTDHSASDKTCPRYKKEKEILYIKHKENISFPEARKRVEATSPLHSSYAAVTKVKMTTKVTIEVQTDLTWPTGRDQPCLLKELAPTNTKETNIDLKKGTLNNAATQCNNESNEKINNLQKPKGPRDHSTGRSTGVQPGNRFEALASEPMQTDPSSPSKNDQKGSQSFGSPGRGRKTSLDRSAFHQKK